MAISADMVRKLREQTGAGMMDCKNALTESNGDFEQAITLLREKGIAVAMKRESRTASEGVIGSFVADGGTTAALVEMNCETTFVAKTDDFTALAKNLAKQAATQGDCPDLDCLLASPYIADPHRSVKEAVTDLMGKIGEKLAVARLVRLGVGGPAGVIGAYVHMGSKGVLVQLACQSQSVAQSADLAQLAKDLAMHISWSAPDYLRHGDIPEDVLEKERAVHRQWAVKEGKPAQVIDRIVEGRMKDFYSKVCLLDQPFIKDEEQTIEGLVNGVGTKVGENISVERFVRFRVGETAGE